MAYRREIFSEVFNALWKRYDETKDSQMVVAVFMQILNDFPDIKKLFDIYYKACETNEPWSDRKIIFRFFQKLTISYETLEIIELVKD